MTQQAKRLSEERLNQLRNGVWEDKAALELLGHIAFLNLDHAATIHGMQDGALLRDLKGQVERLQSDLTTAKEAGRREGLEEAAKICEAVRDGLTGQSHLFRMAEDECIFHIRQIKEKHDADSAG